MKLYQRYSLSILSGILLWAAWPVSPFTFLIFIAFVPLLIVADDTTSRRKFFAYSFLTLLVWNTATTWWIWNASPEGSISAIIPNSLLMYLPLWGYHITKQRFGKSIGYASLIVFWMLFEYVHLNWQLSWPWLSLGNVFAGHPDWVQWYEFTGIGGGTLWVLLVNILIHALWFQKGTIEISKSKKSIIVVVAIAFPLIVSLIINPRNTQSVITAIPQIKDNVVIVQPNIDPYQKFQNQSITEQINILISLSEQKIDTFTKLIVWPETALAANVGINDIQQAVVYKPVFDFVARHPNATLLTGIETNRILGPEKSTPSARKMGNGDYYDSYNAAVVIKANEPLQFYIKSKLVPGVETLPSYVNFLAIVFEKFGGTTGGYAKDTASVAFKVNGEPFVTAPVICYESIYGEYVSSYVKKGANIITIITNDGWWDNTPGHKQHLQYARLRAIETRRYVVRSANTGISAVINQYGDILETRGWNEASSIKYNIPALTAQTFYVKHGDYLYWIASLLAWLMIVWNVVLFLKKKFFRKWEHR